MTITTTNIHEVKVSDVVAAAIRGDLVLQGATQFEQLAFACIAELANPSPETKTAVDEAFAHVEGVKANEAQVKEEAQKAADADKQKQADADLLAKKEAEAKAAAQKKALAEAKVKEAEQALADAKAEALTAAVTVDENEPV